MATTISTLHNGPITAFVRVAEPADGTFVVTSCRHNGRTWGPETFVGRYETRREAEHAQRNVAGA